MAEIKTDENTPEALDQDPTDGVSSVTNNAREVKNIDGPSPIQRPRVNCNDSHSYFSSEPLMKN